MSTARRVVAAFTVSVIPLLLGLPAQAASGAPVARVRLAHLSPDQPAVDGYLEGGGQNHVQGDVGYGAVAGYEQVPPGHYTAAVRTKGAPATATPLATVGIDVSGGQAYTMTLTGPRSAPALTLVTDDLTEPVNGNAKVRVMQGADRGALTVSVRGGPTVGTGVRYGTVSGYVAVPAGRYDIETATPGGAVSSTSQRLNSGKVYSLVVVDAAKGTVTARLHLDAPDTGTPVLTLPGARGGGTSVNLPKVDTKGLGPALLAAVAAVALGLGLPRVLAWRKKRKKK